MEKVTILLNQFFSPAPVGATVLGAALPVLTASTGRPLRIRTASTRGLSGSIRVATVRTAAAATKGGLFAQFKGSPNSEYTRAHSIL